MQRALAVLTLTVCLALAALLGAGEWLSRPARSTVGAPPPDLGATPVRITLPDGGAIGGWFVPGAPGAGAVLLLHGIRSDRRSMLARARMLRADGFAVLLVDLPAHGESSGERIGFGALEAKGVAAALGYVRHRLPGERTGVIGISLGAAALVLGAATPAPDAAVLESMYPGIDSAVANRLAMRLGPLGVMASPMLLWQLPLWIGVDAGQLRPIDAIAGLRAPVLVAAGTHDRHTTWEETQRLYQAASAPKELWAVPGAAHVDLHAWDPQAYAARVLPFLARHLRH